MAMLGGEGEGEPLDGDVNSGSVGGGSEHEASTTNGNDEGAVRPAPVVAAPFPAPAELRESLGFLIAARKLALPGVRFGEGADDGRVVALAALDRFGLLLVSSATGVCRQGLRELFTAPYGVHTLNRYLKSARVCVCAGRRCVT